MTIEGRDAVSRIDGLEEAARTAFDEAPKDYVEIAVIRSRRGGIVALQRNAERIEGVGRINADAVQHRRDTGVGPDSERQRSRLIARLTPVPKTFDREIDIGRDLILEASETPVPLERDLQIVERREVGAVCRSGEVAEVRNKDRRSRYRCIDQGFVAPVREGRADVTAIGKETRAAA